jgi:DNA-binding CsgD family transcriptional regulator
MPRLTASMTVRVAILRLRSRAGSLLPGSTVLAGYGALAAAAAVIAIGGVDGGELVGLAAASALVVFRSSSLVRRLRWWLVADAVIGVAFLGLTGAPNSPLFLVVLAGVVWAASVAPGVGGRAYAFALSAGYLAFVLPSAAEHRLLAGAAGNLASVVALGLVTDTLRRRIEGIDAAAASERFGRHLAAALGDRLVAAPAVVAAAGHGLTAAQSELLTFLLVGCSNREIAEALSQSEATVKAHLTALYRQLGVRGRAEAVAEARRLGLDRALLAVATQPARSATPAPGPRGVAVAAATFEASRPDRRHARS